MSLDYIYNNMNLEKYKNKFEYLVSLIGKNTKVILEIGGHYGEDTLRFYKYFPESKIYSFEPDPRNIIIFKKFCSEIKNIELIEKAVYNLDNEFLDFYLSYSDFDVLQKKYNYIGTEDYVKLKLNNSGSSSLKEKKNTKFKKVKVNTIRLDTWYKSIKNLNLIDFLWIDVQGAEKEVLLGAIDVLKKVRFVQIEYGEVSYEGAMTKKDTFDFFKNNNFDLILDYSPNSPVGDFLFKNNKL